MRLLHFAVGVVAWHLLACAGSAMGQSVPPTGEPLLSSPRHAPGGQERSYRVLLVYSEPRMTPAIVMVDETMRSTIQARSPVPVYFYTEYLDLNLFDGPVPQREMRELLRRKYAARPIDLIVVVGRAWRIALYNRADLFSGAPVVFVAADRTETATLKPDADVTGTWLHVRWTETLDLARLLQPETRRAVVIGGTSPTDRVWLDTARAQLSGYPGPITVSYLADLSLEDILKEVAALPTQTVVIVGTLLRDATGRDFTTPEVARRIVAASRVPVYGIVETVIGTGVVGGHVVSFEAHGRVASELALRVLAGERPPPTDALTTVPMFDFRQVKRWGIDPGRLPPGSVIRFSEPSLWDRYRWAIIGTLALVVLESLLVAGLVVQRARRKRAEAEAAVQRGQLAHAQRVATMGALAATLAHEINQPLGAIVSNAEAASRLVGPAEPKRTDLLETLGDIIDDGQRASEVIRRLRAMLRKGEPEQKPCDINALIVEVTKFLGVDLARAGVSTELRLRESLPLVRGDAIQLQQVLLNLVMNAADAMADGADGPRRLTVETSERAPGVVEICLRDTGIGVKEGDLEGIFEPLVTTKTAGLGMGLSISRSIVEAHGGTIRAEHNPGGGLSVIVTLPCGVRS